MIENPLYASDDEYFRKKTGKTLGEWKELIDNWGGLDQGHTKLVVYLKRVHKLSDKWAHAVAVRCQSDEYMTRSDKL